MHTQYATYSDLNNYLSGLANAQQQSQLGGLFGYQQLANTIAIPQAFMAPAPEKKSKTKNRFVDELRDEITKWHGNILRG